MLFPILLAGGFFAGTYGSLIGAGGGFLLVPLLLLLFPDVGLGTIAATSLMAVLFTGLSGTWAYARLRRIDYKMGITLALATLPGAVLGVYLVPHLPRALFQGVFGALLILVALYTFVRHQSRARRAAIPVAHAYSHTLVDSQGMVYSYPMRRTFGSSVCFGTGFLSSILGIGGGLLQVPLFVYALGTPIQVATATSQFIVTSTAFTGTLTHFFAGNLSMELWNMLALTLGVVAGAQVGARLSSRIGGKRLAQLLALGLAVVGARLLMGVL
ncbi:MAG: sulfite exporter TauE/SafE family protein [Chloroflexi bacterium]|nr:sulfite exporter TauE/SafE family protein [Chloroflexota bacterium]